MDVPKGQQLCVAGLQFPQLGKDERGLLHV